MPHGGLFNAVPERSSFDRDSVDRRMELTRALLLTAGDDRLAFRSVYALTSAHLFGICLRICRDRATAEDILADVYFVVWRRAKTWDPQRGSAITWLATIARNRAIDWRRARDARGFEIDIATCDIRDDAPDIEATLLARERGNQVVRCLNMLDERQQTAIRAAFFEGSTYAELASHSGVPLSTMKSVVRRGLAQMRRELDRDDPVLSPTAQTNHFPIAELISV